MALPKVAKKPFVLCQIMREIQEHKIKIYEFPETDDEEENRLVKKIKVSPDHHTSMLLLITNPDFFMPKSCPFTRTNCHSLLWEVIPLSR